jgi:hypothetical protein
VKIPYEALDLRTAAKAAGARWDPTSKLWKMTGATIRRLHLESRVIHGMHDADIYPHT